MATAEFFKFTGILSATLSQHHLSGFEIARLEITSPPLTLFVVMLPKAHLILHSKMSGSRLVTTPSWLSGSLRSFLYSSDLSEGFPYGSAGKESTCNVGDLGSIPGLGRSPGEGKGYPLQYSGLESSTDCIVHRVVKSQA